MKKANIIKLGIFICVVTGLLALYFLTPFNDYLEIDKISQLAIDVPENALTALIFLGVFFIGGSLLIPIPLMAFTVSLVFNIWMSVLICIPGFLLASLSGYGIGRAIGRDSFGEGLKKHTKTIKDKMDDRGAIGFGCNIDCSGYYSVCCFLVIKEKTTNRINIRIAIC